MPFNDRARLDPTQVEDRRGGGVGTKVAVGGGGLGLVVLVVALLLGVDPSSLGGVIQPQAPASTGSSDSASSVQEQCQSGADANNSEDCRMVGFVNSIQAFWTDEFAQRGSSYTPAKLVIFTDATEAACGYASAAVGPFYCPNDQKVYLDLSFFNELRTRFGAQGGAFAEAYVLAHEYGHHVQNLTGALEGAGGAGDTGPNSAAVMSATHSESVSV